MYHLWTLLDTQPISSRPLPATLLFSSWFWCGAGVKGAAGDDAAVRSRRRRGWEGSTLAHFSLANTWTAAGWRTWQLDGRFKRTTMFETIMALLWKRGCPAEVLESLSVPSVWWIYRVIWEQSPDWWTDAASLILWFKTVGGRRGSCGGVITASILFFFFSPLREADWSLVAHLSLLVKSKTKQR